MLSALGAPERRRLKRARGVPVEPQPPPAPVATTRATIVDTRPLADSAEAEQWLRSLDLAAAARAELGTLNRLMRAHRLAAANPHVHELAADDAISIRAGYGEGEEVADGHFSNARELPASAPGRRRRSAVLRPQERLAALLGGRETALACEELVLRARLDADSGREIETALGTRAALDAALVELDGIRGLEDRLRELRGMHAAVAEAAAAAPGGGLSEEQLAAVGRGLSRLEAALRARLILDLK